MESRSIVLSNWHKDVNHSGSGISSLMLYGIQIRDSHIGQTFYD